jgi:hypothetical protein
MNYDASGRATPDRVRSDTELDAVFAATDSGVLAAIRQWIDLDGGLAEIIGSPPWLERRHTPDPPPENDESPTDSWRHH